MFGEWPMVILQGFEVPRIQGSSEMLKSYKELKVWQKSYALCLRIYRVTKLFPKEEIYGMTSQIRRSALSVPSNIAEGYGRKSTAEYLRSLYMAYGSVCELETQAMISAELEYAERYGLRELLNGIVEVERMLKALIRSLETKHSNP